MPRYAYVSGAFVPHRKANVHIEDRGLQFADSVYEVIACLGGNLADERGHLDRLERSLGELQIAMPVARPVLSRLIRELVRKNRLRNANIYIQVTRGAARRDFKFPARVRPNLIMTSWPVRFPADDTLPAGMAVVTVPDLRWKRRDIKTTALIAQVMAKQEAYRQGAGEAWMVDESGAITEGSSSNAWIVTADNVLVTRKASNDILRGVTRTALFNICEELQLRIEERAFTVEEARQAREAFTSSAVAMIVPVTRIDGQTIGSGAAGPVARRLHEEYRRYIREQGDQHPWTA